jgi:hypothetical protein
MLREFIDRQGATWRVWEVHPTLQIAPALTDGWLCFDCSGTRRRFAGIPPGWELWDADALAELCSRATQNGQGATEGRT